MARSIQPSHSQAPGVKAFLGPLAAGIFWLVIASQFPYERLPDWLSGLDIPRDVLGASAPSLLKTVFHVFALWAGVRAVWALVRIARRFAGTVRFAQLPQASAAARTGMSKSRTPGASTASNRDSGARAKQAMPQVQRAPTIQRMR